MFPRINPYAISPGCMQELISLQEYFRTAGLDAGLIELLRTRVSQINGCAQGVELHSRIARELGESEERLSGLEAWRDAGCFTRREWAALSWTESVTLVSQSKVPDSDFEAVRQWFSEEEVLKLTFLIAAANAWDRVAVSLR